MKCDMCKELSMVTQSHIFNLWFFFLEIKSEMWKRDDQPTLEDKTSGSSSEWFYVYKSRPPNVAYGIYVISVGSNWNFILHFRFPIVQ